MLDLGLAAFPDHPVLSRLAALADRADGGPAAAEPALPGPGPDAPETPGLRFNMGCGRNQLPGYTNVDQSPVCGPDQVADLEATPWPWPDDCAVEVVFNHSLEHMGGDPKVFLAIMRELYRICRPDATVIINAPHPRHDNFIGDPTHVRAITPQVLSLFSRGENDRWAQQGASNTPLAHYLDVDFEMVSSNVELDEPYRTRLATGAATPDQVQDALRERNNVATEFRMVVKVRKPNR